MPMLGVARRSSVRGARGARAGAAIAFALAVAPSAAAAGPRFAPVEDVSLWGHRVTWLFWYTSIFAIVAFALVTAALVWFSWRYRARAGHRAVYTHGTDRKSFWVTAVLASLVFVLIDMNLVLQSQKDVDAYLYNFPDGPHVLKVEVMPQQWAWNFRYPGADGAFNTADDVVTFNDFRVPVDRPVMLNLKAKDVIHSFYLPSLRIKHDANPGVVTRTWFQAKKTGSFEIACSQMCGWAHYKMRGTLGVVSAKDFDAWYQDAQDDAKRRFDPADVEALWGWAWEQGPATRKAEAAPFATKVAALTR